MNLYKSLFFPNPKGHDKKNANLLRFYMCEISQDCPSPIHLLKAACINGSHIILFANFVTVLLRVMVVKVYRLLIC